MCGSSILFGHDFAKQCCKFDLFRPPVISVPQTSYTVAENETLDFQITGYDPDGGALVFTGSVLPEGAVLNPVTGVFSWTPGSEQAGEYTVTFTVTDPDDVTDSADVTFTVTDTNRAPVLTPAETVAAEEGMTVTFQVPAEDPDGDPLTFSLTAAPEGMTADADTGMITWTPGAGQGGEHDSRNPECVTTVFEYEDIEDTGGFKRITLWNEEKDKPIKVLSSYPQHGETDVPVSIEAAVGFDSAVRSDTTMKQKGPGVDGSNFYLQEEKTGWIVRGTVTVKNDGTDTGAVRGAVFKPDRRLKYNTRYKMKVSGVRGYNPDDRGTGFSVRFRTAGIRCIGSVDVEYPYDISVLRKCRIAVANGTTDMKTDNDKFGVVLIDVGNPDAPEVKTEEKISGSTLGIDAVIGSGTDDGRVVAVSGGLKKINNPL
ncbi:MAG: hypothetical protein GY795_48105 [Desulfobacterales bacterium]|nr:hypothetical protein [Desulfobacterales bacterium]